MKKSGLHKPGQEAVTAKGWLKAHKWLLARRAAQLGFLSLFLTGPLLGFWIAKGTIAQSLTFEVLPLTDPFVALQTLSAGHVLASTALIGVAVVVVAYAVLGGKLYCSWVCPINLVSDLASWTRRLLGLKGGLKLNRQTRYWIMGGALIGSMVTGSLVWEAVNPITTIYRDIVFGTLLVGYGLYMVAAIFLFETLIADRGWCGHLCPVGAFYGLIGIKGTVKVNANNRADCNSCMDCFAVCPEPQVITPALKAKAINKTPVILEKDCTSCGRCIDVCSKNVFAFQLGRQPKAFDLEADQRSHSDNPPQSKAA